MALNPMKLVWAFFWVLIIAACQPASDTAATANPLESKEEDVKSAVNEAMASTGTGAPALWKISDPDTTLYLFGTVHNLPDNLSWETDVFSTAFNNAQKLYLEVDLTSKDAKRRMEIFRQENGELPVGQSLFEHMNVADAYNLKRSISAMGVNPIEFEHLQPWLAALQISQLRLSRSGFNRASGIETILIKRASKSGKTVKYLESVEDQMLALSQGDFREQIDILSSFIRNQNGSDLGMNLVMQEWLDGDIHGLGRLVANPDIGYSQNSYNALLVARNKNWLDILSDQLNQPEQTFVAVGAAHLAGPDSLLKMLETTDFNVERIQ